MRAMMVLTFLWATTYAQEPVRDLCVDGGEVVCAADSLEIVFEGQLENSVWTYSAESQSEVIPARVVLDVLHPRIRGFSFGVRHNSDDLNPLLGARGLNFGDAGLDSLLGPDTASTPARNLGAMPRLIVVKGVRQGFLVGIVLNFSEPVVLPLGRQRLVNANYRLERDVGEEGTLLRFAEDLGDPPTRIVLTVDTDDGDRESRQPRQVVDGWVRRGVSILRGDANGDRRLDIVDAIVILRALSSRAEPPFSCDDIYDTDDNGRVQLTDVVRLVQFLFRHGPAIAPPLGGCGADTTADGLSCGESNCG